MAFCSKCGNQLSDEAFCPKCGAKVGAPDAEQKSAASTINSIGEKIKEFNNTEDTTDAFDKADIEENKLMAVLAYLGPLVFLPIFVTPKSKFARYHANQGLTLFIADVAYGIAQFIIGLILAAIFPYRFNANATSFANLATRGVVYNILSFIFWLPWVAILVLAVIGIINSLNGKAKELPFIGKFKFLN